jgi:hypothetical protein
MAAINRHHFPGAEALPPARDASALPTGILNADLVGSFGFSWFEDACPSSALGGSVSSGQVRFGGVSG